VGDDVTGFVRTVGRRAFRRPLTEQEEAKYRDVFSLGERLYGAGFANGASLVIRALLQSPHFLYRTELGPAGGVLTGYELASKLSFWLLGTTPSDALLDVAATGQLDSPDGLVAAATQMLEDPRAVSVMRDFHGQLLRARYFDGVSKAGLPEYTPAVNPELSLVSNAFFDRIFQQNLGLRGLLTSTQAYVSPALAPFYGVDAPSAGLELRDVGPARSGFFMQVPFLMLWANNAAPNSIQRGFQLEAAILCGPPRPEPPSALTPPPPVMPGQTNRQRVASFTATGCGNCHRVYIDPLGFAFEDFDGLGRKREVDTGQRIDTTGSYPLSTGVERFSDGNELMRILANSPQAHTCYSKRLTGYALGREMAEDDRPLLEELGEVSRSRPLKELITALVRSPTFRTRKDGLP